MGRYLRFCVLVRSHESPLLFNSVRTKRSNLTRVCLNLEDTRIHSDAFHVITFVQQASARVQQLVNWCIFIKSNHYRIDQNIAHANKAQPKRCAHVSTRCAIIPGFNSWHNSLRISDIVQSVDCTQVLTFRGTRMDTKCKTRFLWDQ